MEFSHLDGDGKARMVDVGEKPLSRRTAHASAVIRMNPETIRAIREKALPKGDVLTVAKIAGINAAKKNGGIIPLCHPIILDFVNITFHIKEDSVEIETKTACIGRTGVEMEALAAASGAALGLYDMCKAVDKGMIISDIRLLKKSKQPVDQPGK